MEKKYNYVYKVVNTINDKVYIGDHSTNNEITFYKGGGLYLNNAKRKYGRKNFTLIPLEYFPTKQEAFNTQEKYILEYNSIAPNGYNLSPKGGCGVQGCFSEESIQKMRNSHIGKTLPEEQKIKIGLAGLGRIMRQDSKDKLSKARKGKPNIKLRGHKHNEESKKLMSIKCTGRKHTDETKKSISDNNGKSMLGKHWSDEMKEQIRQKNIGQKRSVETRRKQSEKKKGCIPWNKGKKGCQVAWNKGITGYSIKRNKTINVE